MDEAVALVIAAPIVALALWAVAFAGSFANGEARAAVGAELAAQAAAQANGPEATDSAERVALGATISACRQTDTTLARVDSGRTATVAVVCDVPGPLPGNRVCFTGYAQTRPAASANVRTACAASP